MSLIEMHSFIKIKGFKVQKIPTDNNEGFEDTIKIKKEIKKFLFFSLKYPHICVLLNPDLFRIDSSDEFHREMGF